MRLSKKQIELLDSDFQISLILANNPVEAAQVMLNMGETMSDTPDEEELGAVADRLIAAGKKQELLNRLGLLFPNWEALTAEIRERISAHVYAARQKNFVGPPMEDGSLVSNTGNGTGNSGGNWMEIFNTIGSVLTPLVGAISGQGQQPPSGGQQQPPQNQQNNSNWYDNPMMVAGALIGAMVVAVGGFFAIKSLSD